MIWRFRITLGIFCFAFLLVISRLFYWQVVKAQELSDLGQSQYGSTITIEPKRGQILTSDSFEIAANKVSYLVFANPKEIKEKDQAAKLLADTLTIDPATISAQLSLNRFWVPIQWSVDYTTKQKIDSLHIPGVGFDEGATRYYPEASMAAHLLGFVGKDDQGLDTGYFGLEGYYNRLLRGKPGVAVEIHDAVGRPILAKANENSGAINGKSLVLHIDRAIQYDLEQKLKDGLEKYGAQRASAIVMDPKTGAILAMATFPTYDEKKFWQYPPELYKDPIITDTYEPGSTFKSLVMSAGIDAKVVKPDTQCDNCAGPVSIGGYDIQTWNNQYFPNISMIDVIKHSDNTGMVFVAKKLGLTKMYNYLDKFGIGHSTGVDIQGETTAEVKPIDQWYPIDLATASFGQGIVVTPIELLDAFSAIANDGIRMEPHVVAKIQDEAGVTQDILPKELSEPISSSTAKVMTEILVNAVNKGEAQFARLHGYRIAGKTGTAQIPIAGHYDASKTIASFIGFAPADNPKFSMLVVYDRPTSSIYGAETAAPTFFSIAKDILNYYGIAPTVAEE